MNPESLREFLKGKKTYLAVLIGLLYLAGVWAGAWAFDEKVLGAIGLSGLAFLGAKINRQALLLAALCALPLVGCARFATTQTDLRYENGKPSTAITTKASAYTLFSSRSDLARWKAIQSEKSQSAEVGNLSQQGGTNTAATLSALAELLRALQTAP